jgi:hypothetical protein
LLTTLFVSDEANTHTDESDDIALFVSDIEVEVTLPKMNKSEVLFDSEIKPENTAEFESNEEVTTVLVSDV